MLIETLKENHSVCQFGINRSPPVVRGRNISLTPLNHVCYAKQFTHGFLSRLHLTHWGFHRTQCWMAVLASAVYQVADAGPFWIRHRKVTWWNCHIEVVYMDIPLRLFRHHLTNRFPDRLPSRFSFSCIFIQQGFSGALSETRALISVAAAVLQPLALHLIGRRTVLRVGYRARGVPSTTSVTTTAAMWHSGCCAWLKQRGLNLLSLEMDSRGMHNEFGYKGFGWQSRKQLCKQEGISAAEGIRR